MEDEFTTDTKLRTIADPCWYILIEEMKGGTWPEYYALILRPLVRLSHNEVKWNMMQKIDEE
jgi:hypothetical protein